MGTTRFVIDLILPATLRFTLTEMSTKGVSFGVKAAGV